MNNPADETEQAVAPDASVAWLSSNFLASEVGWLSLGAGEQQRYAASHVIVRASLRRSSDEKVSARVFV
jgi:hypothetical protein